MAPSRKVESSSPRKRPPARTPEAREQQLIGLAVDLAEKQLREGTASSQVITHILKLGSTRNQLEMKKLESETALAMSKNEAMASAQRVEELYGKALQAMSMYQGRDVEPDDEF